MFHSEESYTDTLKKRPLYIYVNLLKINARRYGLSANTIQNRLRKSNYLISADRP